MNANSESTLKISLALLFTLGGGVWAGSAGWSEKANKSELTAVEKRTAAIETRSAVWESRQADMLEILKEIKQQTRDTDSKIDGIKAEQTLTLREIIKIKDSQLPPPQTR